MDRDLVLVLVCDFAERITQPIRKGNIIVIIYFILYSFSFFFASAPHYATGASAGRRKQRSRAEITSALLRFSLQSYYI